MTYQCLTAELVEDEDVMPNPEDGEEGEDGEPRKKPGDDLGDDEEEDGEKEEEM